MRSTVYVCTLLDKPRKKLEAANPVEVCAVCAAIVTYAARIVVTCSCKQRRGVCVCVCVTQVSDVILPDPTKDVGARNERRLVAVYCNKEANFEVVHGLLNRVMEVLGVPWQGEWACVGVWVCERHVVV